MPTLGGGPPALSLLTGVARGLTSARHERQKRRRDAILNRLKEQQIESAKSRIELAEEREERYREQQALEAQRLREERERERKKREAQARQDRQMVEARMAYLQETTDLPEEAIRARATMEIMSERNLDWGVGQEEPKPEPEEPSQREIDRSEYDQIMGNKRVRDMIHQAPHLEHALSVGQEYNLSPTVVEEVYNDLQDYKTEEKEFPSVGFEPSDETLRAFRVEARNNANKLVQDAIANDIPEDVAPAYIAKQIREQLEQVLATTDTPNEKAIAKLKMLIDVLDGMSARSGLGGES